MDLYPMKLQAPLKDYIWGGTKLKTDYGKKTDLEKVSESWELACHKDGMSIIENGPEAGRTLKSYLDEAGPAVLGEHAKKFPYFPLLIKLIDAKDNLSVQVHPDNDYAMRVEGEYGKTEMWYIVDCEPGATLIYGFKHAISKEEFEKRIADNTLLEVCNQVPVHKGMFFSSPRARCMPSARASSSARSSRIPTRRTASMTMAASARTASRVSSTSRRPSTSRTSSRSKSARISMW